MDILEFPKQGKKVTITMQLKQSMESAKLKTLKQRFSL